MSNQTVTRLGEHGEAPSPVAPGTSVLFGILCWVGQPLSLVVELVVGAAVRAPYSWVDNTISDLGARSCTTVAHPGLDVAVCSPLHAVLNASFVLGGVTTALGAWLLLRRPAGTARLLGRHGWRGARAWVVVGLLSTASSLFLTLRLDPAWGGLLERLGIWPSALGLAVLAGVIYRGLGPASQQG